MPTTTTALRSAQQQTATMSPRLQHAVRLLQMSSLDFAQAVGQALDRNPFLESEDGEDDAALPLVAGDAAPASSPEGEAALGAGATADDEPPFEVPGSWTDAPRGAAPEDGDASAMELVAAPVSLFAHLHAQLDVLPLGERDLALAKAVVESLDEDGYLRSDPRELVAALALDPTASEDELGIAVRRVQSLDPAGVGARSVQECLRLQLDSIACAETKALARRIIESQLRLLAARDAAGIARELGCAQPAVEDACARIRRFDPRPGWRYGGAPASYLTPDVIARRHRRRWVAMLNPAVIPRLRLNREFVDLYRSHRAAAGPGLAEQLHEARWTLRNVEQRFATIVAVAQAIVDRQRHFLDYGEMAMKPLVLKEIADAVGVHESTVSRVTSNKYIATPAGVFELKRFFSRAMVMHDGAECSPTAIRGLVRELIANEPPGRPLSDAELTLMLQRQGLSVARRTVTKYRQALRIEPATRRRCAR